MKFREMQPQDIAGVFAVRTRTRENRLTMEELKNRGITPESILQIINESAKGWVCEDGNEIVGFTMGDGRSGEVLVLAVLPEAEGKGIGRQLMQRVQDWLFSQGHRELWLMENPDPSIRAYRFYRRLGWVGYRRNTA
jgi:ribosomal protein S18 acetylase RimI-like enzyme